MHYEAPAPGPAGADPTTAKPGARAPHAWVAVNGHRRGLLDLFDGHLTLLTGRHGDRWRTCADRLAADLPLRVLTLGHELRDGGGAFRRRYALGDEAALLIRPDGCLAWRADAADDPPRQLTAAVDLALGRPPTARAWWPEPVKAAQGCLAAPALDRAGVRAGKGVRMASLIEAAASQDGARYLLGHGRSGRSSASEP